MAYIPYSLLNDLALSFRNNPQYCLIFTCGKTAKVLYGSKVSKYVVLHSLFLRFFFWFAKISFSVMSKKYRRIHINTHNKRGVKPDHVSPLVQLFVVF